MSTRGTIEFRDKYDSFTLYKHQDMYPEGALQCISNTIRYAWELPRFEASDFAAAFVRANKQRAGDIYMSNGQDSHDDTKYHYVVICRKGRIFIEIQDYYNGTCNGGYLDDLLKEY